VATFNKNFRTKQGIASEGNVDVTGELTTTGNITGLYLRSSNSSGDEGGEILLYKPATNSTIAGTGVTVDIFQNKLRFFEQGGTARGYYLDITAGGANASTNLASGGGTTTNALTIGTGLSGTSFNGSSAVTIAIDSTVATLTGTQTLTNKTLTSPTLTTPSIGVATGTSFNSITGLSSTTPLVDGTAAVGTATTAARGDHVHPTPTSVVATVTGTNSADLVYGNMADNDQFRIRVGGTATNAGFAEIATADDGNEPIYVRQYSGVFTTLTRTATILDSSGNTTFPGTVSATSFNSITGLSATTPSANGSAAVGTATTTARADHVHPTTGLGLTSGTLAQFAATTSAQLAGVISDETGSGALVFANSPTFTGTVNAAAITTTGTVAINTTGTGTINLGDGTLSKTSGTGFQFNSGAVFTSTISASGLAGSLLSSATPIVNGTAAVGTSAIPSRQDHVHGTDTSRAPIASPTFTGSVTLPGAPSSPLQAATKQYVDDVAQGLHIHPSVVAATTANLTATYSNGTSGVGATLTNSGTLAAFSTDGVSPAQNDRVLVKNQTTQLQNGIYTLTTVGSGSVAWVLTRATDMDESAEVDGGDFVFVTGGTTLDNTGWVQTETSVTIGTSSLIFTQFSGAGTYAAGNGLTLTGNTFTINTAITADLSTAQTFTNKTLTSPTLTTPSIGVATGTSFNSITGLSSTTPIVNGTAAVGTATTTARADHVHPTDTSRAATSGTLAQFAATTSAQLAGVISDETGSGALVFATSPTLVTPTLGVASATTINKVTITAPATASTLTIANGKTLTASNTLTFNGTDASTVAFGTGGTVAYTSVATLSSLSSIGTVTTGTWNATAIGAVYGGTGLTSYTTGDIIIASATNTLSKLAAVTSGYVLTSNGAGTAPSWQVASGGGVSTSGGSTITVASGSTVPLTIQNNGTGNSFVVNDVASDTTPFVISANGSVFINGSTVQGQNTGGLTVGGKDIELMQIMGAF
jgi:hypothetical protein